MGGPLHITQEPVSGPLRVMGTTLGELENPVAGSLGAHNTSAEGPGKEWLSPLPFCRGRSEVAAMGSLMPLLLLMVLLNSSHAAGEGWRVDMEVREGGRDSLILSP